MSKTLPLCYDHVLSTNWELLCEEKISCDGYSTITFWVDFIINTSSELRLLLVAKPNNGNNGWYNMRPRIDLKAFYEIEKKGIVKTLEDEDQKYIITYDLDGNIAFLKMYACVAIAGVTPASLSLKYSLL